MMVYCDGVSENLAIWEEVRFNPFERGGRNRAEYKDREPAFADKVDPRFGW
jgi:hypothetical protein